MFMRLSWIENEYEFRFLVNTPLKFRSTSGKTGLDGHLQFTTQNFYPHMVLKIGL